ncbi:hypothetical protein ACQ4PT_052542 [Festuca glaucescens]
MTLPPLPVCINSLCFLLFATAFFLVACRRTDLLSGLLRKLGPMTQRGFGGRGTRRGQSIQVTDRAIAHRALVVHSAAFLHRPTGAVLLYPSRWRQILALRRQQEESFLPLVAAIKSNRDTGVKSYVESLLELRIHEDGGRAVNDGELVSLISEFLGAGTESTAAALEWTMANLVKRPDLQRKLRVEIDAVACTEGVIEEAELSRMPYLRAVVLESLRRHPPVPFVLRHVKGDEAAKALGLLPRGVPDSGATVNFLVGKIGRDGAAWSDPTQFKPERFMPGGEGEGADLTCTRELKLMPFGAGRRACPGLSMAMLHLEYFVANLVREFEWWEAGGDGVVDLTEFRGFFFTVMNRPLRARLVRRGMTCTTRHDTTV